MNPIAFMDSLRECLPPENIPVALAALWWAAKGEWNKAHLIAQNEDDPDAAWVHAYLHRLEGDLDNARYWYGQARRPPATGPLEAEWEAIVEALLAKSD